MATIVPIIAQVAPRRNPTINALNLTNLSHRITVIGDSDQSQTRTLTLTQVDASPKRRTCQNGSESTRMMSSRTAPADSSRIKRSSSRPQTLNITTGELREVGDQWVFVGLAHTILVRLLQFYTLLNHGPQQKAQLLLSLLAALGTAIASILILVLLKDQLTSTTYYVLVMNAAFAMPVMINLGCQLSTVRGGNLVTDQTMFTFMVSVLFYYSIGFLTAVVLWDERVAASVVLVVLIYLTCLVFNLIITVILIMLPFAIVGLVLELIVRIFICEAQCPKRAKVERLFKYQTYLYEKDYFDTPDCVICLSKFEQNEAVCLLLCHSSHVFHEKCILGWLEKQLTCPICRKDIQFKET